MIQVPKIMDVTCRDGSYVLNFQFSLSDQRNVSTGLERVGIQYIEIGHGMGLGASSKIRALHSDREYLKCANNDLKTAKYGVFCIPGTANLDDVKIAAEYGASFIRVGCNVEDIDQAEAYIKEAKRNGLTVMSNYMKSYASSKEEFQEAVKKSEFWGAEYVYIVDSAGSMMPRDIKKYFDAIKEVSNIGIGFHGHDNIGMALANSLYASELGVDFVDCSLQGLGRSSGNTSLETFVVCLKKMGLAVGIEELELLLISKRYVYPLVKRKGLNPIDIECGIDGFHSSYLKTIHKVAAECEVNPLVLIKEYCKIDQVSMDIDKLRKIAKQLPRDADSIVLTDFANYFGEEQ